MENLNFFESSLKMPLMYLPVRSVLVNTEKGNILFSPGSKLRDDQITSAGLVTDIVAPSLFHCGGVAKASSILTQAKLWGPIGVKKIKSEILWASELDPHLWPYNDELVAVPIEGMPKVNEVVFIHKKSKSLIVADLCFNLINQKGFGPWLILNLFGTYEDLGVSRFFLNFVKDRDAFIRSLATLFSYNFDNIIVSHGENVYGRGREKLIKAIEKRGIQGVF